MDPTTYSTIVNNQKAIDKLTGKLTERGIELSEFKQVIKNFLEVGMNVTKIVGVLNEALEEEQSSRIKQIIKRELYPKTIADKSSKKEEPSSIIKLMLDREYSERMKAKYDIDRARYDNAKDKEIRTGIELLVYEQMREIEKEQLSKNKQTLGGKFVERVRSDRQKFLDSFSCCHG